MPEGDTAWRTARNLDRALTGRRLLATDFRVPSIATVDLSGELVEGTVARGKHLLTRIGADHTLHTHLKMEGSWHLYKPGTRWRRPAHDARVVLRTEDWTAVGFALGVTEVLARDAEDTVVGHLGPDLLGPDWDADEALARLLRSPEVPVGEALLDQRNLAGIGNLYKCESLFLLGIHPELPVCEVHVLPEVVDKAQRLLVMNRERAEQTTTGNARRGQRHWVYGRAGQPCRRCGTPIESETLATLRDQARASGEVSSVDNPSQARVTYWCPTSQPAPS